ncbi:MAG: hypothetical protein ACLPV4_23330 [Solirubrobacteraceae bacterium]
MVVLDIVLMALISAAIVGLLVWGICTQHRHYGCADLRVRGRRLRISVRLITPDQTELAGRSYIGTQI